MRVKITINQVVVLEALLNETETARKIYNALPITGQASTWGEEIYFSSDVIADSENPREVLEAGEIAYWPPMRAICIFYGPTPASQGNEIRAAGPVNVVGKIKGNISLLKHLREPLNVALEKQ